MTALFVDDRPLESDVTPLWAALSPVDVEVESEVTLLLVEERPVDREVTPL